MFLPEIHDILSLPHTAQSVNVQIAVCRAVIFYAIVGEGLGPVAVPGKAFAAYAARPLPTAATRFPPFLRHRRRSGRSPSLIFPHSERQNRSENVDLQTILHGDPPTLREGQAPPLLWDCSTNRNLSAAVRYRVTPNGGRSTTRVRNELSAATRRKIGI